MRKLVLVSIILLLLGVGSELALAQQGVPDYSTGRLFGIGAEVTFPMVGPASPNWPNMFPATGLSTRLWLADLFGLDAAFWVFPGFPSFAIRSLFKLFNTPIVDIYSGLGVAFFNGAAPFQGLTGLEISISHNLALIAEVGVFGLGGTTGGVTAGLGAHFYF